LWQVKASSAALRELRGLFTDLLNDGSLLVTWSEQFVTALVESISTAATKFVCATVLDLFIGLLRF
jgi:hypothetical protein